MTHVRKINIIKLPIVQHYGTELLFVCQDHNDPLKNDEEGVLDERTMDGLKLMGAFGLQVPEEYG